MARPKGWHPGPGVNQGGRPAIGVRVRVDMTSAQRERIERQCPEGGTVADAVRILLAVGLDRRALDPGAACGPDDVPAVGRADQANVSPSVRLPSALVTGVQAVADSAGVPFPRALRMVLTDAIGS